MTLSARLRTSYIVSDYLSVNLAWFIFNLARYSTLPYNYNTLSIGSYYKLPNIILGEIIFPLMMLAIYAVSGFYNRMLGKSRLDVVLNTMGMSLLGSIIIFFIVLYNDNIDDRMHNYEMILLLWLLMSVFSVIPRLIITSHIIKRIASHDITLRTLIVGTSAKARKIADDLDNRYPKMGFTVCGFVNYGNDSWETQADNLPVIRADEVEAWATQNGIQAFIVIDDSDDKHNTINIINSLLPLGRSIYITPDIFYFITSRPRTNTVVGEVLIDVTDNNIPASTLNIKRIADIVISLLALLILSPFLAVVAIMVKRTSPGPVIYKQERVGLNKRKFMIYKFRSMYVNSEPTGPALSSANDPRITPIGRFLRKYRIDEFPQFWNVIKGDMSLVGPRPEREYYLRQIISRAPYFNLLHRVRPGITSWGMVKFGYAQDIEQMLNRCRYDLLYVDNLSLALDIKILIYTIKTVLTGKGV